MKTCQYTSGVTIGVCLLIDEAENVPVGALGTHWMQTLWLFVSFVQME